MTKQPVLLVGAGPMAMEYAKVLKELGTDFIVVGLGENSARNFEQTIEKPVVCGGIDAFLSSNAVVPAKAIVCVTENALGTTTRALIDKGVKTILVEKPGGLTAMDIRQTAMKAQQANVDLSVGYNRRFYQSVEKAQKLIVEDGGVTSFHFEFTEWSHVIGDLVKAPGVKEEWFLANSTHVVDLAFFLGGNPVEMSCYTTGGLSWHPTASIFTGAGKAESGALFSYCANWEAPGRWGVEILTRKRRLILRPLEKLQVQKIGSVAIEDVPLDNELDQQFKPGLYRQVECFVTSQGQALLKMEEHLVNLTNYLFILKGQCIK